MCENETYNTNTKHKIMRTDADYIVVPPNGGDTIQSSPPDYPARNTHPSLPKNGAAEGKFLPKNFKEISLILTFFDHATSRF